MKKLIVVLSLFAITALADEELLPEIAPVDDAPLPELQGNIPDDMQVSSDPEISPSEPIQGLTIITDCGDCKVDEAILQLLKATYTGKVPPTAKPITYTIKKYSSRSTGARIAFGALAGKDQIQGIAKFDGGTKEIGDTAITILCGTECVARNVAEDLAKLQH